MTAKIASAFLFSYVVTFSAVALASMQTAPATPVWAGWARCQIDVQGPGYTEHQTHTWAISAGGPSVEGAFRIYPATWSVVGSGSLNRTQGNQTLRAQWAINGMSGNAPIAVFVRASDGRMFIQARHAQMRSPGGVAGYQQVTIDGKAQPPASISSEAFEWSFPVIDVASTATAANGSSSPTVNGSVGFMQPGASRGTAACNWQFGQGASAPAPPPRLAAQAVPAPPTGQSSAPPSAATTTPQLTVTPLPVTVPALTGSPTATTTPTQVTTTSPTQPSTQVATTTPNQATTTSPSAPATTVTAAPVRVTTTSPATPTTSSASTTAGMRAFTASGSFTVPAGVTSVAVELWGAGAGGASSTTSPGQRGLSTSGYSYLPGVQGHGGGGGAYTRITLPVSTGTTLRVVIGAGGMGGVIRYTGGPAYQGFDEGADGTDGSSTQLTVDGRMLAEAAGGKANGMGGPKSTAPGVIALAGYDGVAAGSGGAAVAGSITPVGTTGGNGGPGPTGGCVLNPLAGPQCDVWSNPGSNGLSGYGLISWTSN